LSENQVGRLPGSLRDDRDLPQFLALPPQLHVNAVRTDAFMRRRMTWRTDIRNILRMSFRALLQSGALNIREILEKQGIQ
jgi:hypothetical protein